MAGAKIVDKPAEPVCSVNEPAVPSMTFGGDASASESEVRGKCVSAMCLVRFAS